MNEHKRVESLKRRYGKSTASMSGHGMGMGQGPGAPGNHAHGGKRIPEKSKETVRRLLHYLNEDKGKMFLAFLCVILNTVCTLAGSYMLRPIINTYIAPTGRKQR